MKPELTINNLSLGENNELIYREGKALELKEPTTVRIAGNLDSPLRWLEKRLSEINPKACNIIVNRQDLTIELDIDETNHYGAHITGCLLWHPMFLLFGVNAGKYISNFEMAKLIKMNRTVFETQGTAMELVFELQNFRAKIDREVEKLDDNRGNKRDLKAQVVESNLPKSFNLVMPIFKGTPPRTFEVEVYINPDDFSCTLISPTVNDFIEEMRDSEINSVLNAIIELAPDLVIIEQ